MTKYKYLNKTNRLNKYVYKVIDLVSKKYYKYKINKQKKIESQYIREYKYYSNNSIEKLNIVKYKKFRQLYILKVGQFITNILPFMTIIYAYEKQLSSLNKTALITQIKEIQALSQLEFVQLKLTIIEILLLLLSGLFIFLLVFNILYMFEKRCMKQSINIIDDIITHKEFQNLKNIITKKDEF